jgi:Putative zinc-finger/WD40-like Beta Propeller Repeat
MTFDRDRHPDYEELISASLRGDLSDAERRRLDTHLDGCAACRDTLAAFSEQRRIMGGLRHVPPPRDLGARVRAGIERRAPVDRVPWWRRPPAILAGVGGGLAVVAGALLALVLLDQPADDPEVGRNSPTPTIAMEPSPTTGEEPTLAPLETPAATAVPTLPPASLAPTSESLEPAPTASPVESTPEPEAFLAVTGPTDNQQMTVRAGSPDTTTGTTLAEVETPPDATGAQTGVPIVAELSPDGQWIAFLVDLGLSGQTEIRATRVAGATPSDDPDPSPPFDSPVAVGETVKLAESVGGSPFVEHLFWAPDSRYLAFTVVDREDASTDAWIFDPATGEVSQLTNVGNAYAGSWVPGESGTSLLWVSTASEAPESHLLLIHDDAGAITPHDPSEDPFASVADVFQPIVSPNGALVIYWTGRMDRPEGEWLFVDGGAPVLAENRQDSERGFTFEEARDVFRDVPVDEAGFESAAIRWGPDGDAFAVWEAAWTGEDLGVEASFPDRGRVYLTRATDPRGLTPDHAIDAADVPEDSSVVDVKVDGTGRHLALTARKPIPGDLSSPEAELFLVTRNTGQVADDVEVLGSEPEQWFGPAVFTPEAWAGLVGE